MVGGGNFVSAALLDQLILRLQDFDDEALVALGNRGLFRRASKDLEQQLPSLQEDAIKLRLSFAGQQIEFASGEPRAGRCDCKASSTCQHLLAVLLWLRAQPRVAQPLQTLSVDKSGVAQSHVDADALLLSIDDATLKAFAGTAGFRWALAYALDLDLEREFAFSGQRYPILSLPRLQFELRCVGTSLAEFLGSGPDSSAKKHTVAALLAYKRSRGEALATPEIRAMDTADQAARTRLICEICQFARELITLGLTHLSPAVAQRTELLATWAQAQGCYRLAARLRRCGEQIDASLARLAHSDSAALLDELAFAYALAKALQQALSQGHWPRALLGQARQDYEESDALSLWGVAAWPFESASGFRGLSVLFYAPAECEFLTLTDARPTSLSFDPLTRFTQYGPWSGMSSPSAALGQILQVQQPRRAGQRLSANEATLVQQVSALPLADLAALPQISDWRALPRSGARSLWSIGAEDFACIRPASWQPAQFDPHRQMLRWSVRDDAGRDLLLSLPYSKMHARAVAAWESFADTATPGSVLIFVRLRDEAIQPVGYLQLQGDAVLAGTPFFSELESSFVLPALPKQDSVNEHPEILAWRSFLLTHAERGIGASWPDALAQRQARAQSHGLLKLAQLSATTPSAEALLRSWVYLQQLSAEYLRERNSPSLP